MSRLTNKKLVDLKYGEFLAISKEEYRKQVHEAPTYKEIYTKLGQLEDLEEQLGCPLEIVSKILLAKIDEIIVNYGDGGYGSPYTEYITASISNIYRDTRKGIVIETNICEIPLKDYGVNWWLKGEIERL